MRHSNILQWGLRLISIFFIFSAGGITWVSYREYQQSTSVFPPGEMLAGVDVGGLDGQSAAARLLQIYSAPIEIHYQNSTFDVTPDQLGFKLDTAAMLSQASQGMRQSFFDFLLSRPVAPAIIPLQSSLDAGVMQNYLTAQVASRYDQPALSAMPIPGTKDFTPGQNGRALDLAAAQTRLTAALRSPTARSVQFKALAIAAPRASLQNLQVMLNQIVNTSGFDGLAEVYVADLKANQSFDFAINQNSPIQNGVAFTAASTVKIAVMVSVFLREPDPIPADVQTLLQNMIEASDNPSTDEVVQKAIDPVRGPLEVTADMQKLGYANTFWAGYFYDGAPLLQRFDTPDNSRTDVATQADIYNQTTPAEMGDLLAEIYHCAANGTGKLVTTFPGKFNPARCQQMIDLLKKNDNPALLRAGLPEGTPIGHKHGWVTGTDGYVHVYDDVAVVYTPGGDFVMSVYLYRTGQLLFDPADLLMADLSGAVYNYFNPPPAVNP
jgi:beta-lactamase class A